MKRYRGVALAVVLVLVTAACSRSGSPSAESTSSNSQGSSSASGGGDTAVANGGFGDLTKVCSPGTPRAAPAGLRRTRA